MIVDRGRVAAALPGYQLGTELGAGAFGLVLAARHRELNRPVAVKVVPAGRNSGAEAQLLAAMDHPHVVRVYDYVKSDDLHLIVMEVLPGGTLTRRAPMSQEAACASGLAVAAALSCAHAQGVLHRDVKPDNVLFDSSGLLKVTDFGIAKLVEGAEATASGVVGTPSYMAPEQIRGGRLGATTDLYALGVVLYQLLTGAPPFSPKLPVREIWQRHLDEVPAPMVGVPLEVAEVVLAALAKDPGARPPSAHALSLALAPAATRVYGPGWIARSGLVLRLDDEVRDATAHDPAATRRLPPSGQLGQPARLSHPGQLGESDTLRPTVHRREARFGHGRRLTRRHLAAVVLLLVLLAAVGFAIRAIGSDHAGAGRGGFVAPRPLGPPLELHTGGVETVAFSPNGRILASTSQDGTVRLWDLADPAAPKPLGRPLTGHVGAVDSVAFAPDGRTLATTGQDNTLRLWDVADPAAASQLGPPVVVQAEDVYTVAFSPTGQVLADASWDQTVRLWNVADPTAPVGWGEPLRHTGPVFTLAFSPPGNILATAGSDEAVHLWDVHDPAAVRQVGQPLTGHTQWVEAVAFSPDGRTLASASKDETVRLWDVTDLAAPRPLGAPLVGHDGDVFAVAFSPNGRTLASASGDEMVRLWDVTDPAAPRLLGEPLAEHTGPVRSVVFSPDGALLATGSYDHTIRLWEVAQ